MVQSLTSIRSPIRRGWRSRACPTAALWVWSPIHLDPQLRDEVEALGKPAHLVSPNKIHHLFLGEWKAAYPGAKLWGLPAVARKRRDLELRRRTGRPAAHGVAAGNRSGGFSREPVYG